MSAYVINKRNYDFLVSFLMSRRNQALYFNLTGEGHELINFSRPERPVDMEKIEAAIQILIDQNYASVNYRYKQNDIPEQYTFDRITQHIGRVESPKIDPLTLCFTILSHYEYQACETPEFERSPAYVLITVIKDSLVRLLPGYEDSYKGIY